MWVLCWSGVASGGMPARDRADAAAVRDAWADGGSAADVLAGVRRAVPAADSGLAFLHREITAARAFLFLGS